MINAAANGPVVYVRTLLGPSKTDIVCSGDDMEGNSSMSLLTSACLLTASKRSVLLVIEGEPSDVVGCSVGCVGGRGCMGKPDCIWEKLERSLIRLNLFW